MTYSQAVRWAAKEAPDNNKVAELIAALYNRPIGVVKARIKERTELKIIDGRKWPA